MKQLNDNKREDSYLWMPTPLGAGFAARLQFVLATIMFEGEQKEVYQKCNLLMPMAGLGGDMIAMAHFFKNVRAGDFCAQRLKFCRKNVKEALNLKNVQVENFTQNVVNRDDIHKYDAVVLAPFWTNKVYLDNGRKNTPLAIGTDWYIEDLSESQYPTNSVTLEAFILQIFQEEESNVKVVGALVPLDFDIVSFAKSIGERKLITFLYMPGHAGETEVDTNHIRTIPNNGFDGKKKYTFDDWKGWQMYKDQSGKTLNYGGNDRFIYVAREDEKKFDENFLRTFNSMPKESQTGARPPGHEFVMLGKGKRATRKEEQWKNGIANSKRGDKALHNAGRTNPAFNPNKKNGRNNNNQKWRGNGGSRKTTHKRNFHSRYKKEADKAFYDAIQERFRGREVPNYDELRKRSQEAV